MDPLEGFLLAIGWFLLRFGLPIAATVLLCWFFKRLDAKWQAEADIYRQDIGLESHRPSIRCWLFNKCSEEKRSKCIAYQNSQIPCWQHFRGASGELKEECIGCGVFRGFPKPAIGD
jgi:hypothetical protein